MFHYSNIYSFATAFEYMKLHLKVWPCPHPAIKGCVPLLLHAKNLAEVPFLSFTIWRKSLQGPTMQRDALRRRAIVAQNRLFFYSERRRTTCRSKRRCHAKLYRCAGKFWHDVMSHRVAGPCDDASYCELGLSLYGSTSTTNMQANSKSWV